MDVNHISESKKRWWNKLEAMSDQINKILLAVTADHVRYEELDKFMRRQDKCMSELKTRVRVLETRCAMLFGGLALLGAISGYLIKGIMGT